ncbi:hypothetical protein [Sphingomonas bacterium]|uniref:hypothetical protein n=1 Tax=Sphingomonas bacterium TaxID=1895847 RepID=UPI00157672F8
MDDHEQDRGRPDGGSPAGTPVEPSSGRRRALMLGAVGAASVMSIRPALAQTHASVMTCEIPVPDAARRGRYIATDGSTVPSGTTGAFAPPGAPLKGEDVRRATTGGGPLPGVEYERSQAYMNYIRRLQRGTGGFTCFASLQMPRS